MNTSIKNFGARILSKKARRRILRATRWPRVGTVDWGDLRRLTPVGKAWGSDRGQPIDRYYIESFLSDHTADIYGSVMEIGERTYTVSFGQSAVTDSRILTAPNDLSTEADYYADLSSAPELPSDFFDCAICTQTLHLIEAAADAIGTLHRTLKPGGKLLMTLPGIQIHKNERGGWDDLYRYTINSGKMLVASHFPSDMIEVRSYGNVLSAASFLYGIASEELSRKELDYFDSSYQLLIAIRATKRRA